MNEKKIIWGNGKGPIKYITPSGLIYIGWPGEFFMNNSFCIDLHGWGPSPSRGSFTTGIPISNWQYRKTHSTGARAEFDIYRKAIYLWDDRDHGKYTFIFKDKEMFYKYMQRVIEQRLLTNGQLRKLLRGYK